MEIRQIIDKIDDDQLFVPAFQREYVWKRPNVKALFSSLIHKYPCGTLLTWDTTSPPELKGAKKYHPDMGSVKLILDGQQRITSIYMITKGRLPPYYTSEEIKTNVRGLYVNLLNLDLEYFKKQTMENNPLWVELTQIFDGTVRASDIRREYFMGRERDARIEDKIDDHFQAINAIQSREFPEQIIPVSATVKEAINIFYMVNASGVNLTDAELALAQITGYWPQARDTFKAKLSELENSGFVFKLDFIVYILLAILYDQGSDLKRLHSEENNESIRVAWARLETNVLDYVVNVLKTHAYVDHSDEINSVFALIPIISYVFKKKDANLNDEEIKKAIKWFYYSQVRQRYMSQTQQKLDKDLGIIRDSSSPFDELLSVIQAERPLEICKDEFFGKDVRHPLFSLMRWYFKSKNAVCLSSGVGLRKNMGAQYVLEKDHIFPYSALRDNGYPVENRFKYAQAQEITNRAILTRTENRTKSDTAAFDYLSNASRNYPEALGQQCIPEDPSLWYIQRFEDFLEKRRAILADELNTFLSAITASNLDEGVIEIDELIADGEHNGLEFKSTLRWDLGLSTVSKDREQDILKAISAFNNGEGGTLIIGVDDDRNVLGLDLDYATFGEGSDRDEFERRLRTLVNRAWGIEFGTTNIKVDFPRVGEHELCTIEVERGTKPLYLQVQDRHGRKSEKFYVRSGNSSQPFDNPSQIASYVGRRFPQARSEYR